MMSEMVRDCQMQVSVWDEEIFLYLLTLEQRRSKRSYSPFILMLLNFMKENDSGRSILQSAMPAITSSVRETDVVGWLEYPRVLGIIFTQLDQVRRDPQKLIARARLEKAVEKKLGHESANTIAISAHVFPEDSGDQEAIWHPAERFAFPALSSQI